MPYLFAHISWMPEYSGNPGEPIFSTHGWVLENNDAHEKWNFKPVGKKFLGYLPIRGKKNSEDPGEISIEKLQSIKGAESVDGVTVIWFANNPNFPKQAYVVGWYRNATVFRKSQSRGHRDYRISCDIDDATLLAPEARNFLVPHIRSQHGQELGYGYGQSSLWYAGGGTERFLEQVQEYIDVVDQFSDRTDGNVVSEIDDAIDDLDGDNVGNENPDRRQYNGSFIVRNPNVRRRVIARANGSCEYCGELGFLRDDGSRFVEAHHIIHLARQGPDTLDNVIALCPNHHRQAHFGKDREIFEAELKAKLVELRGK